MGDKQMTRTGVVGIGGRMGSLIARTVHADDNMKLCGALEAPSHPMIGNDAGLHLGIGQTGVIIASTHEEAFADCDVIIDFSMPQVSMGVASYASSNGKFLVIGTTGFTEEQKADIEKMAADTAIVMAPNMSIGVNVMFKVSAILTKMLGDAYDIEIVEAHHKHKKDAPSGTADGLARAIADARGVDLEEKARYERHGIIGERPQGEIGIQTIRAGDIVGDHTVLFAGGGERIELTHRAHSRENFANGAVRAAGWVASKKEPGLYSMMDVLGLNDEDR